MFLIKPFKHLLFIFLLFSVFLFSACSLGDPLARLPKLPDGTLLENYVRPDPIIVATYFPTDAEEKSQFVKHLDTIAPQNSRDLWKYIVSLFPLNSLFEIVGSSFFTDPLPEALLTVWDEKKTGSTEFLMVTVQDDPERIRASLLKQKENPEEAPVPIPITEQDKNIFLEIANEPPLFAVLTGNKLIFASKKEFLAPSGDHSFLQNPDYQNFLRKSPKHFAGYAYAKDTFQKSPSLLVYGAEEDGIFISSIQKKQNHADVNLAKKIPAKNMIFGAEGTNLASMVELEKEILKNTPFFKSLYGDNPFQGLEEKIGLSYEQDIKPFLQKNFAWVMEDQGKIIPAVSLWIDAFDNPQSAEKVFKKVDETLSAFNTVANAVLSAVPPASAEGTETVIQRPFKSPFERKTIDFNGSSLNQIVFIPQDFPQDKMLVPLFENLDETWAFTYGLTKDNLLVFSTRSEFPTNTPGQAHTKTWTDQDLYNELRSHIRGYSKTDHVYFETKPFLDWISRIMELGQDSSALSAKEKRGFKILQKYLAPIQGGIAGTRIKGDMAETKMFIKIGK